MAEIMTCKTCHNIINLEIDIHRDEENNIVCNFCNTVIKI